MRRGGKRGRGRKRPKTEKASISTPTAPRVEADVFEDLRKLAQSPGFIHALAALTFKSNVVTALDEFTVDDFMQIYQPDRLIRTETNLLAGLMLSADVDTTVPEPQTTQHYMDRSVALLEELHEAISPHYRHRSIADWENPSENKQTPEDRSSQPDPLLIWP